jgi:hypothetical protein
MIFKLLTRDGTLGIAQHTNYNMIRIMALKTFRTGFVELFQISLTVSVVCPGHRCVDAQRTS